MPITKAEFLISSPDYRKCPEPKKPEYAFIGRSNVGKSSLINMLTNNKKLAKTSSSPGKTQLINHFTINNNWYLVDLPGYGYAKTSKSNRNKWHKMISDYLINRPNLMCTFVLVDSRISPQDIDVEFINSLGEMHIPFVIVFTKKDKISGIKLEELVESYKKVLSETWEDIPSFFYTSAEKKLGKDEIIDFIESANKNFEIPIEK